MVKQIYLVGLLASGLLSAALEARMPEQSRPPHGGALLRKRQESAMCGRNGGGGNARCGMNVCCSASGWCGTTEAFCFQSDAWSPCQQGFGTCGRIAPPPSCAPSGDIDKRTVGYYQGENANTRECHPVPASAIKTSRYTHLNYAFASIDPTSFAVRPAQEADKARYREFTSLKRPGLETWIAIGGYEFSNNGAPTHTTWSDLVSTAGNRAAFISSLIQFMNEYGFQGADLDWEFPGTPSRGGNPSDTQNFVLLVQDMRRAFDATGKRYGISLPLPPDYDSLRFFDAKAMQPHVDWFNFMAYDLASGSTDTVRGHVDMRDILKYMEPLWFAGMDPKKINLGLAWYGRGYTLTNPQDCNHMGCPAAGLSAKAPCSGSEGVMTLQDIQAKIASGNTLVRNVDGGMMKSLVWDNQWIGYDDEDTFKLKKNKAAEMCFGGTMYWSVDLQPM